MALGTPAWAAGSATIPTRVLRHLPAALTGVPVISHANSATATTRGGGYGVAAGGDLAVTTTGALGYSVAAGHFGLPGTSATGQGMYVGYNDAAVTGTLPARNATNPYIAYICVQIRDSDEDATGSEDATIAVIQGTPAASPAAPSVPSSLGSLLILSEVLVPSSANGGPVVFTDRRMYLNSVGGVQRVTSALRPTGSALYAGLTIHELDTNREFRHNGTGLVFMAHTGRENLARGETVAGGVIDADTTGSLTDWVLPFSVTAPPWATVARVTCLIAGITEATAGQNTYLVRFGLGTSYQPVLAAVVGTGTTGRFQVVLVGAITLAAVGVQSFKIQTARTAGIGTFRLDTNSYVSANIEFQP